MTSSSYYSLVGYLTRQSHLSFSRALQASSAPRIYLEEYMPHGRPLSILQVLTWSFSGRPPGPSGVSGTARHHNTATARYAFSTSLTPQPYRCGVVPSALPG
ncbi:hypothetical protein IG631_01060 [Alternaria alternata]|jgi:hypothetical protein|nr:hypothetical protein IG631_01060 [Alternaria alternata]